MTKNPIEVINFDDVFYLKVSENYYGSEVHAFI